MKQRALPSSLDGLYLQLALALGSGMRLGLQELPDSTEMVR
jgi:hypothetical protein